MADKVNRPKVCGPSSVIVVGAAVALPTMATAPGASGTAAVLQLAALVQL